MSVRLGVPAETATGERRVALVPDVVARLVKNGYEVLVEKGAGKAAHFVDFAYEEAGARLIDSAAELIAQADLLLKVAPPNLEEIAAMPEGTAVIGYMNAYNSPDRVNALCQRKITAFSMELVPRISRAQSIDSLSSQATIAGYRAALIGAQLSGRFYPMLTTAAGTIRPAKVLIMGAGVAGLQAIATARRLGAVVEAYDVRRAAGEQVQSLGAKFLALELNAEAEGGYARELTAEEKVKEQEMLNKHVSQADVVITTAQIPGRAAPKLISKEMVSIMKPGAVIVDLAAESGGNCELTKAGETVDHDGVIIYGPINVASSLPVHASEMYAKNLLNFIALFSNEGGKLEFNWDDEVVAGSALTHNGEIKHESVRQALTGATT
ncbi:MAG: NAD(P)(+) transhydrogenase (Re/Si-specific) subunit alpha [Gammaproteobacteria bacterium]|nr:MAG: NAD(P)(+) transhydrogenase (Re/Si-specific) subunit alpha [Gammaproteobacteria bacterium]